VELEVQVQLKRSVMDLVQVMHLPLVSHCQMVLHLG
jgi:hypothetical protein